MPTPIKKNSRAIQKPSNSPRQTRRSFAITERGISTDSDLAAFISAAMSDVNGGRIDLREAMILSSFSGKLIAIANLQFKMGLQAKKPVRAAVQIAPQNGRLARVC